MLVVCLFVIPGAILGLPAAQDVVASSGLTLRDAYLVLSLPAAILLGAFAAWSADGVATSLTRSARVGLTGRA